MSNKEIYDVQMLNLVEKQVEVPENFIENETEMKNITAFTYKDALELCFSQGEETKGSIIGSKPLMILLRQ